MLARAGDFAWDGRLTRNLVIVTAASLAMGIGLLAVMPYLDPYLAGAAPLYERVVGLAALVIGGAAVFFAIVTATGVLRLSMLRRAA
jgi:peptidoglycan biosynthesis protein MviN/MurJ (putative lipid II flippase)